MPWKCPKCGEQIEDQFDTCWKCAKSVSNEESKDYVKSGLTDGKDGMESAGEVPTQVAQSSGNKPKYTLGNLIADLFSTDSEKDSPEILLKIAHYGNSALPELRKYSFKDNLQAAKRAIWACGELWLASSADVNDTVAFF